MDQKTTIQELKDQIQKFCDDRDWDQFHSPKDLATGIITEASELLEVFRYKTDQQQHEIMSDSQKRQHIAEELSDVTFQLLRFVQKYNFDLSSSFRKKLKEISLKYPVQKAKGSNRKYNEI